MIEHGSLKPMVVGLIPTLGTYMAKKIISIILRRLFGVSKIYTNKKDFIDDKKIDLFKKMKALLDHAAKLCSSNLETLQILSDKLSYASKNIKGMSREELNACISEILANLEEIKLTEKHIDQISSIVDRGNSLLMKSSSWDKTLKDFVADLEDMTHHYNLDEGTNIITQQTT